MKRKIIFSTLFLSLLLMLLASPTIFASDYNNVIDLEDSVAVPIPEEMVIIDLMNAKGIDRETAEKELGISMLPIPTTGVVSSCSVGWFRFNSTKKVIDPLSGAALSISPLAQLRECPNSSGTSRTFLQVSPSTSWNLENPLGGASISGLPSAVVSSPTTLYVNATGTIKNYLGTTLRTWTYDDTISSARPYSGGGSPF